MKTLALLNDATGGYLVVGLLFIQVWAFGLQLKSGLKEDKRDEPDDKQY